MGLFVRLNQCSLLQILTKLMKGVVFDVGEKL